MSELVIDGARIVIPEGVRLDLTGWTDENGRVKNNYIEGPGIIDSGEGIKWVRILPRDAPILTDEPKVQMGPVRTA